MARTRDREVSVSWTGTQPASPPPRPIHRRLTGAISRAALAPRTPGLADAAAAELAGEARGQRVLALVLRAHQAKAEALLLRLVCCRGQ